MAQALVKKINPLLISVTQSVLNRELQSAYQEKSICEFRQESNSDQWLMTWNQIEDQSSTALPCDDCRVKFSRNI